MGSVFLAVSLLVGGTGLAILAERMEASTALVVGVVVVSYVAAALIAWWSRWVAAVKGFRHPERGAVPTKEEWDATKITEIVGRTYQNEKVDIDAKRFVNCSFTSATLVFRGTGPFHFVGRCEFTGEMQIEVTHPATNCISQYIEGLRKMQIPGARVEFKAGVVDAHGRVTPVNPVQVLDVVIGPKAKP